MNIDHAQYSQIKIRQSHFSFPMIQHSKCVYGYGDEESAILVIIILIIMKNSGLNAEEKISSTEGFYQESRPISQVEIQQRYIHLQTILMLTQLNSAYYQMQLSLHKTLSKIQNRYYSIKMHAFSSLNNFKSHLYQIQSKNNNKNYSEISEKGILQNEGLQINDINSILKTRARPSAIILYNSEISKGKLVIKTKSVLTKLSKILTNKMCNLICFSFFQMLKCSNQTSTIKILSEKSSKIQTIDSQKSKVFKRSTEKRVNRKSFSVQKPIDKSQYFVPIKYQAQQNHQPKGTSIIEEQKNEGNVSELNRLLQKNIEPSSKERRNMLMGRQRKALKTNSSKKINLSEINNSKEQKINELEYLQRKYTKLISQFNWFSERFLRVIEQQV